MTTSTPDRRRLPVGSTRALAVVPGLAIVAVLTAIDLWAQPATAVVGFVLVAPLLTALFGAPRDVALVGTVSVGVVLLSAIWHDNFGDSIYVYRVVLVSTVSLLALLATRNRMRAGRDRERFSILAAVAEIADGTLSLTATVEALNEIVVPAIADICIVDAMRQGELERLAVRVDDRLGAEAAELLAARAPSTLDRLGNPEEPRLLARIDASVLQQISTDEVDLAGLRTLGVTSAVIVPLRARGRRLGSLTLIATTRSGRTYDSEDLEFARVLAGRAALALDNAGLYSELETIEAQLTAALSTLAEAVTVQHTEGALIYANEAAAEMLGFESPQELLATPVDEVVARFATTTEDGSPLRLEDIPGRKVLAGEVPEPLVVRSIDRRTGVESWRVTKASGVYDRDGNVKLVVNVIEDITEVKRAEMTQRLLARAGELLTSSLNYEHTLQQVAEMAVPQLADWCAVSLPDGHGYLRSVAVAHVDPEKVAVARRIGERYPTRADAPTGSAQVMRDGLPQVVNEVTDEMIDVVAEDEEHAELVRSVGLRAGIVVPMVAAGLNIGVLTLASAETPRRFSDADVELAQELARRAGAAVTNTRLYKERSHIARTLQAALLPGRLPHMPGWQLATLYRPAGDENWVGGDFYDAFAVRGGWLAIVGDVAGRGAEAASLTGLARYTLRTAAQLLDDPLAAVARLNAELRTQEQMSLCSVAAVLLRDEEDGRATADVICAGHPLPLLVRDGQARTVGGFSPMLGAHDVDDWSRTTTELEPGDVLVLYTDGVFDAVGADGRFGEDRLQRTVAGVTDAQSAVDVIDGALTDFEVGPQADDTAVLAVQRAAVTAGTIPAPGGVRGQSGEHR
ncbi:MAG TPA: SpoIIE family protein phosphatase [Solirubrobacteraceae bacterium]|nr:SpoIIE family protein phosphatase [Solirubrobacteraceae bacterium]